MIGMGVCIGSRGLNVLVERGYMYLSHFLNVVYLLDMDMYCIYIFLDMDMYCIYIFLDMDTYTLHPLSNQTSLHPLLTL